MMKKSKKKTMKNIQNKRAKRNQRRRSNGNSGGEPRLVWSEGNEKFYEFDQQDSENPGIFSSMLIKEFDDLIDRDDEEEGAEPGDFQVDLFF